MRWRPATGDALAGGRTAPDPRDAAARAAAERRAAALRLPLVWPERWPGSGSGAMRVAALAAERGRAAPFVLAAGRLAFCGGYDLDDPEVLAEAAAAAGLALDDALRAAGDCAATARMEAHGAAPARAAAPTSCPRVHRRAPAVLRRGPPRARPPPRRPHSPPLRRRRAARPG